MDVTHESIQAKREVVLKYPDHRYHKDFLEIYDELDDLIDKGDSKKIVKLLWKERELFDKMNDEIDQKYAKLYLYILMFIIVCLVLIFILK